jgi:hypothetical protein
MEKTNMKKLILVASVLLAAPFIWTQAQPSDEREAVRRAVLHYVEGVYNVDPSRIERSVHPDLNKIGFWRQKEKEDYASGKMTFAGLVEVAKNWNKDGKLPANAPKEITIFDVQDQTASAKLVAQWGTDYFHLAKYDGKWKIINVLWQSPPPIRNQAGKNALLEKKFLQSDFGKLRWLEGTWRGTDGKNLIFYERYQFIDETTIEFKSFGQDQTLTKIKRRGTIAYKDGAILSLEDSTGSTVIAIDDKSVHFESQGDPRNSYSFEKESRDIWLARLKYTDSQGTPAETVFRMERVK